MEVTVHIETGVEGWEKHPQEQCSQQGECDASIGRLNFMGWFSDACQNEADGQSKSSTECVHSHAASSVECFKHSMDQLFVQRVSDTAKYAHDEYLKWPSPAQHDPKCDQLGCCRIQRRYECLFTDVYMLVLPSTVKHMLPEIREQYIELYHNGVDEESI